MSDFNINNITSREGQQGTVLAGITTVNSTGAMRVPSGPTDHRGGRGRGFFGGGYQATPAGNSKRVSYIEIATTGNSVSFGDLTVARQKCASFASATRGIWAGGADPAVYNNIQYITIQTTGNAIDFGDLIAATKSAGGCSSPTRGLIMGGQAPADTNVISYITMATLGNATDFGDLTVSCRALYTFSSKTRGISGGGEDTPASPYLRNHIDYVTIAATGNATDFGDLTAAAGNGPGGCSDVHGGLGD